MRRGFPRGAAIGHKIKPRAEKTAAAFVF